MVTESSQSSEPGTGLLRAARSGNLEKVLEYLNTVDINTSNANGLNALHLASKDGHLPVVQELLKRGADVNAATKKGNTSLHIAALAGQEDVVKLLVQSGANVNVQSQNGFSPLYMASQENHDGVVQFLLSNGANQALATEDGFTPLAVAMQQGHDKVVSLLLSHDSRGKARLPALHIAAKKNDLSAAGLLLMSSPTPDLTSKSNFTPLHIAAHYGNAQVATLLLDKGADVNFRAKHQITPLHVAAKWGKSAVAGLLIERGADVGGKTRDGLTPLHCASRSGHEQLVDLLVEKGAAIGAKTKNGLTPLHMSAQGDHVPSARILLFHKAPVDDVTVDYLTPLHVSAHCGHVRVAKLLLDKKADPNSRALNGFTPLHIACKKNRIKVVELLLQHGASIEASTESGLTPLHVASFMGCMNIAIFLLQNGAEVEARTVRGETPLHLAARANQTDIVRILLRNGASVDSKAKEEQTPLHIAARLGNSDLVMLLLQHGANPDDRTKEQLTAVHISAKEGQEEVCSLLLDHGAAAAPETSRGFTPLHLAAKNGHAGVAKLLIAKGAPPNAVGRNGLTPLHVATSHAHPQIATILLDAGADPRAVTKNGHTPLHIAGKKNQLEIGAKLIPHSDVNARSKAGFTPVHIAAMEGNLEFVKMLIGHGAETSPVAENHLTPLHLAAQEDRVGVADTLRATGVQIDPRTAAGYTPLHIASHFGHSGMVKYLVQNGADIQAKTNYGNTPLHHAAQQGQAGTVSVLLEKGAEPDALNAASQTPLSIASKLNYVSVVESLRRVTKQESTIDKYKVVLPETMLEGLASDSEDEGVDEPEVYKYLTVDDMKSLGDDSMPMDVEGAMDDMEEIRTTGAASELSMSAPGGGVGFLVSFMVDARGGAMRGCRHSGIRVVIPPLTAPAPTRVTCKYLRKERLAHPPPLMEGEALASRILELGPVGVKFLGKVTIDVPHFASMRTGEREIVVLRSEDGITWREHTSDPESEQQAKELEVNRLTRITTTDFPQYFALVSRIKQEVHAVGPEGGVVSSSVVKEVTATFPAGALTKRIRVGIQAHPIPLALVTKHGSKLSVSPIVTVEPRRRKFHKPISLSIPLPSSKDPNSSLRLLCSITGGSTRAQWEDVTGSTPLTFINDHVSFTTTVSARFWLIDSRQGTNELTRLATEIYREAIIVPFMAKFLVYAKRIDPNEARLRVFCMTDDREDKTLEGLENFTEVAKSKDVEVLEGKPQYLEMAGNLSPVSKSGEQLRLKFYAFRENRLGLLVRLRDSNAGGVGRIVFRKEPKGTSSDHEVPPTVNLNISLPIDILPDEPLSQPPSCVSSPRLPYGSRYGSGLRTAMFGVPQQTGEIHKADLRLSDVANLLGQDWRQLAVELGIGSEDIAMIADEYAESPYQQATVMLRLWMQQAGDRATGNNLEKALNRIHREDIVEQCISSLDRVTDLEEQIIAKTQIESTKTEKGRNVSYDEEDIMKDSESIEDVSQVEVPKQASISFSPMTTSYETDEVKYGPEEKDVQQPASMTPSLDSTGDTGFGLSFPNTPQPPEEPEEITEAEVSEISVSSQTLLVDEGKGSTYVDKGSSPVLEIQGIHVDVCVGTQVDTGTKSVDTDDLPRETVGTAAVAVAVDEEETEVSLSRSWDEDDLPLELDEDGSEGSDEVRAFTFTDDTVMLEGLRRESQVQLTGDHLEPILETSDEDADPELIHQRVTVEKREEVTWTTEESSSSAEEEERASVSPAVAKQSQFVVQLQPTFSPPRGTDETPCSAESVVATDSGSASVASGSADSARSSSGSSVGSAADLPSPVLSSSSEGDTEPFAFEQEILNNINTDSETGAVPEKVKQARVGENLAAVAVASQNGLKEKAAPVLQDQPSQEEVENALEDEIESYVKEQKSLEDLNAQPPNEIRPEEIKNDEDLLHTGKETESEQRQEIKGETEEAPPRSPAEDVHLEPNSEKLDWLIPSEAETPTQLSPEPEKQLDWLKPAEPPSPEPEKQLEWLSPAESEVPTQSSPEIEPEKQLDWLTPAEAPAQSSPEEEKQLDWLTPTQAEAPSHSSPEPEPEKPLDWLTPAEPRIESSLEPEKQLDWLTPTEAPPPTQPSTEPEKQLDWLTPAEPESHSSPEPEPEKQLDWLTPSEAPPPTQISPEPEKQLDWLKPAETQNASSTESEHEEHEIPITSEDRRDLNAEPERLTKADEPADSKPKEDKDSRHADQIEEISGKLPEESESDDTRDAEYRFRSSSSSESEPGQDQFPESRFKAAFDEDSSRATSVSPVGQTELEADEAAISDEDEESIEAPPIPMRLNLEKPKPEPTVDSEPDEPNREDDKNLATTAAVQLIEEIEERVEERLQAASEASSAGVTPTDDPTPKVSTDSKQSSACGVVGSSSTVSFFTAREERSPRLTSEDRPKSSDSSTLAFISSSEYQTPGSLTESQSTLGEDEPTVGGFSKGITCDLGTISGTGGVTLTSSIAGTSAACGVSHQESTFESRISGDADEPNEDGNMLLSSHLHQLEDIEEELISSTPKGSLEGSTNEDKFKRPASSSSSLNEFEKLESAVLEEFSKEELLSEIEEGLESQTSEATEVPAIVGIAGAASVDIEDEDVDWKELLEQDNTTTNTTTTAPKIP